MITIEGKKIITRIKFMGTKIPANIPKLETGIISESPVAKKAAAVVEEVANMAFEALLKVVAIILFLSPSSSFEIRDCLQASMNTKISSAAIPKITKIAKMCKLEKYLTWNTRLNSTRVKGKDIII